MFFAWLLLLIQRYWYKKPVREQPKLHLISLAGLGAIELHVDSLLSVGDGVALGSTRLVNGLSCRRIILTHVRILTHANELIGWTYDERIDGGFEVGYFCYTFNGVDTVQRLGPVCSLHTLSSEVCTAESNADTRLMAVGIVARHLSALEGSFIRRR